MKMTKPINAKPHALIDYELAGSLLILRKPWSYYTMWR